MKSGLVVRRKVMLLLEQARENKSVRFFWLFYDHSQQFPDSSAIRSRQALTSFCPRKGTRLGENSMRYGTTVCHFLSSPRRDH